MGIIAVKNKWRHLWDKSTSEGSREETVSTKNSNKEFWKCIGYILLEVTYGVKGYKIWESINIKYLGDESGQIYIYFCRKTDLLKVNFSLYHFRYSFLSHWNILSYATSLVYWVLLWVLTYIGTLNVCGVSLTRFKELKAFWTCSFTCT